MTFEQAMKLNIEDIVHHNYNKNYDGSCQRWKVNGKTKTWKTRPGEFRIPLKHGLRLYDYLTERNLDLCHTEEDCTN